MLNIAEVKGNWERIEEAYKPTLVMGFKRIKFDLLALGRLTYEQTPLHIQLRMQRKAVACLMGHASGLGFGLVLWVQGNLFSESGEITPLYQGRSSNF